MADTKHKTTGAGGDVPVQRAPERSRVSRWDRNPSAMGGNWTRGSFSPFAIMRQGVDEMERWFSEMGRGWSSPRRMMSPMGEMAQQPGDWAPAIEAFQRGNEFIVRAEVPGMNRQDLTVEIGDDALTIRGERRHERDDERDGMFWSERSYGSFTRVVPLPPGTITDSAKASFRNGILEVVMQAPSSEARRGRRIDISGSSEDRT
jgi:HSP20 family protein